MKEDELENKSIHFSTNRLAQQISVSLESIQIFEIIFNALQKRKFKENVRVTFQNIMKNDN